LKFPSRGTDGGDRRERGDRRDRARESSRRRDEDSSTSWAIVGAIAIVLGVALCGGTTTHRFLGVENTRK